MLVMAFALVLQVQSLLFCIPKLHAKHTAVLLTLTRLPGVNEAVKFDNKLIFFLGEVSALEVRAQVVDPPETAALAAAEETGGLGEGAPATFAVGSDVSYKAFVFFFSPSALVGVSFLTARRPSHNRPLQTRTRIATCFLQSSFELRTELNTVTSKHDDLICPDSLAAA
nr:hypothetical protein BHM03_00060017 [Ipomoea batatas]